MSFTGDLEHLSIVDVVQLLHATRKSGTLTVTGRKGESQLVFSDGYIISANHCDNSLRVGNILVEAGVIPAAALQQALHDQQRAGEGRRPLVAMLIEQGLVRKEDAYRGLETLIELTIVDILTWKRGSFTLDVGNVSLSDEYRYFPEKLHQEITLHTENVLMDALRIYDEKKRDGFLTDEELTDDEPAAAQPVAAAAGDVLSADDLGLGDLDSLERKIPTVFAGLDVSGPLALHRHKVSELGADLPAVDQEALLAFLGSHSTRPRHEAESLPGVSVVFYSNDDLLTHCVTTVCRHEGMFVLATNEEQDLAPIIGQSLAKGETPVLLLDAPRPDDGRFDVTKLSLLRRQQKARHPELCTLQLTAPGDYDLSLRAFTDGVRAAIPRPVPGGQESFVADLTLFLETLPSLLKEIGRDMATHGPVQFRSSFLALRDLREPQEVAFALLQAVSGLFERSLTLIVRETELIAERGIGIKGEKSRGPSSVLGYRIPLAQPSLFRQVLDKGAAFWGGTDDETIQQHLFAAIGAPLRPTILLLPLKSCGKMISLTYADFGRGEAANVPVPYLEMLAAQAGLVLENALYRKKRPSP